MINDTKVKVKSIHSELVYMSWRTCLPIINTNSNGFQVMNLTSRVDLDGQTYRNDPKFSDRYAWANSADPDQTAPRGAVWSGSTLFAIPSASFGLITL